MAKPTAPLLSFDARGTIAKTVVYASWRGRGYARRWTVPANPRTTSQLETRHVFSWLSAVWKEAPTDFQAPWTAYAAGQPMTNRNALNKFNISALRTQTTLMDFIMCPGAKGGLALASIVVTAGAGQLTITATAPAVPTGWTLSSVVAAAIADQDPHSGLLYAITLGSDTSLPYSVVLTGLSSAALYRVGAWTVWLKPDASLAYGPSIAGSGTPT